MYLSNYLLHCLSLFPKRPLIFSPAWQHCPPRGLLEGLQREFCCACQGSCPSPPEEQRRICPPASRVPKRAQRELQGTALRRGGLQHQKQCESLISSGLLTHKTALYTTKLLPRQHRTFFLNIYQ